jgi:hypothetical protein
MAHCPRPGAASTQRPAISTGGFCGWPGVVFEALPPPKSSSWLLLHAANISSARSAGRRSMAARIFRQQPTSSLG